MSYLSSLNLGATFSGAPPKNYIPRGSTPGTIIGATSSRAPPQELPLSRLHPKSYLLKGSTLGATSFESPPQELPGQGLYLRSYLPCGST